MYFKAIYKAPFGYGFHLHEKPNLDQLGIMESIVKRRICVLNEPIFSRTAYMKLKNLVTNDCVNLQPMYQCNQEVHNVTKFIILANQPPMTTIKGLEPNE